MRYKICGIKIELECDKNGRTYRQAEGYRADFEGEPDMVIKLDRAFIEEKHKQYPHISSDECEYIWTGYEFCKKLLELSGFMLHSSAVAYENKAYLFSAPSGTGKSTHTEIWQRVFGKENAVIINDDKPVIKQEGESFYVYGTPWSGKGDKNLNIKIPLQGICFLQRGEENQIHRISAKDAIMKVLNQTVRPPEANVMNSLLNLLDGLLTNVPVYSLSCNMEDEAAIVSYNGMKDGI